MLTRKFTAIFLSLFISTPNFAFAKDPDVRFDQGTDATGIIKEVRKKGRLRRVLPIPPLPELAPLPPEFKKFGIGDEPLWPKKDTNKKAKGVTKGPFPLPEPVICETMPPSDDDPGGETVDLCGSGKSTKPAGSNPISLAPVTGPYEPLVTDNAEYQTGLEYRGRLDNIGAAITFPENNLISRKPIDPATRMNLILYWNNNVAIPRGDLISAARPLDRDDERLSQFAVRLNRWYARLIDRKGKLEAQISTFNQYCKGELPDDQYRQCVAYRPRLINCQNSHNASSKARAALVDVWLRSKECIKDKGESFREKVEKWAKRILIFIGLVTAAEDGDEMCELIKLGIPFSSPDGNWHAHCEYNCKSELQACGFPAHWDHHPILREHEDTCTQPMSKKLLRCPKPW